MHDCFNLSLLVTVEALATEYLIHGWEKDWVVHRDVQLNVTGVARTKGITQVASLAEARRLIKGTHVLIVQATVNVRQTVKDCITSLYKCKSFLPRDCSSVNIQRRVSLNLNYTQ